MKTIPIEIERNLKLVSRVIEIELAFSEKESDDNVNPISVKSLVGISAMSERSLRDWFKEYKGMNLSDYIKKRQTEYGARIFRLFPDTSKKEVADLIGLSSSQALYPFLKRGGILDIDKLKEQLINSNLVHLSFRQERMPESIMFYILDETDYNLCADPNYESSHWDKIEEFVEVNFPDAVKIGDVGFTIDRYVENKIDEGTFISGILYRNVSMKKIPTGFRDEIGWKIIPRNKYAVFTFRGDYEGLAFFYQSVIHTISQSNEIQMDRSSLIMEKYLNSPVDTLPEELITEIWIPLSN